MQTYNVINNDLTGAELPGKIYENLQSLKSEFSGTSFPTENLVAGMTCYRIDEGKVYRLMPDLNTWEIENNFSGLWEDNEQVKVGDVRYLSDRKYAGYVLECIQAGTTGNAEPVVSDSDVDNATDLEGFSGILQIVHGGHGANTVEGARANLGLSYATQAEAEGGTSNNKVMTPKGVDYRLNKDRQIKTYSTFASLGLSDNPSWSEITTALGRYSELIVYVSTDTQTNLSLPQGGVLRVAPRTWGEIACELFTLGNTPRKYIACYASWISPNFTGWKLCFTEANIATQSQAEAGTDNTTVMTPLRVENRLWKGKQFNTYVGLAGLQSLGIDVSTAKLSDLYNALPSNAELTFWTGNTPQMEIPGDDVIVWVIKYSTALYFWTLQGGLRRFGSYSSSTDTFNGWHKVATQGALSMPSGNAIGISTPTFSDLSDWTINYLYTAPTDGWLNICVASTANDFTNEVSIRGLNTDDPQLFYERMVFRNISDMFACYVPCRKGQVFYMQANKWDRIKILNFSFVYAQSEV